MTRARLMPDLCRLCRAFRLFDACVPEHRADARDILAETAWYIAALERGRPCRDHGRTLSRARERFEALGERSPREAEALR
jgi:hypothetical protein